MSDLAPAPGRGHAPTAADTEPGAVPVSVVMLTYNRGRLVARGLRSLFAQTYRPLQIVVVDDGSTDDTADVVAALLREAPHDVDVSIERHDRNRGIGRARNTGIAAASGSIIAFMDDDCVADADWIAELVRPFEVNALIAVTGGGIDEPSDRTWAQAAAEGINFLGTQERDVRAVVGCNMAFRASFLAQNPFDPSVRYGADELDLCFAAARDGLRVRFTPSARVTHHHRRSIRAFLRQQFARGKGSVWVRRKHHRGHWPNKNWIVLVLLASLGAAPFLAAPLGVLVPAVALALFVAQILVLDRQSGKTIARSAWTLPLVLAGYVAEFFGAASQIVRSALSGAPAEERSPPSET